MKRACIGFLILMLTLPFPSYCFGEDWEEMEAASSGYDFGPISKFVGPESGRPEFGRPESGKDGSDNIGINKILIEGEGTRSTYETSSATSSETESSSSKDGGGAVLSTPSGMGGDPFSITPSP